MLAALILAPALMTTVIDVSIENFAFVPESVSVKMGDTVRWTNKDASAHTSTGTSVGAGAWNSGNLAKNATYLRVFNFIGPFDYRCDIHKSMVGKVVTSAATAVRTDLGRKPVTGAGESALRDARGRSIEIDARKNTTVPAFRKP